MTARTNCRSAHHVVGVALILLAAVRCGGGTPVEPKGVVAGAAAGIVIKGRVASGNVTAYQVDEKLRRGAALARATTNEEGAFAVVLPSYSGALLLVADSGSYIEEAIGLGVRLEGHELSALIPAYKAGAGVDGIRITPMSSLIAAFTTFHVGTLGASLDVAYEEAKRHMNGHFGNIDWTAVTPADLSVAGVSNLSPEATAGLVLAGLSYQARQISEAHGLTPGLVVNAASLTDALVQDVLADGTLDGFGESGVRLKQSEAELNGLTVRRTLAQAITLFLSSDRNASALRLADVKPLLTAIAGSSNPYLFCANRTFTAACAGGGDVDGPVITFVNPTGGAGVNGVVPVQVRAEDGSRIVEFAFVAPTGISSGGATFETNGQVGTLTGTLDVSARADGDVQLSVRAIDEFDNATESTITVTVSNRAPSLSIAAPSDGSTVNGLTLLSVTATAQQGTIQKIELIDPPAGVGPDQLPAADTLGLSWDTTKAPEGFVRLTFRATDTLGTSAERSIGVTVDNVPLGTVTASVFAGEFLENATVKLIAIDDTTGLPVSNRPMGPVLGSSAPTDANGRTTFQLTQENYEGPVQLVAEGMTLSFEDPSGAGTQISIPSTFQITSYVPHYKSGNALTAPVSLWTTLADEAALAYGRGRHPVAGTAAPLTSAMAVTDPLFVSHVSGNVAWNLRTTLPIRMTTPPTQSLRDVVYAAMPDVALNRLARDLSTRLGITPGQVITSITLVELLRADLAADGVFDGRGAGGADLATVGSPSYRLAANTTRFDLALALDRFIRSSRNATGLSRADMQAAQVYDRLCLDTSLLYPSSPPPEPFDYTAPTVTFSATFVAADGATLAPVGASKLVAGTVTITADATDPADVASVLVAVDGTALTALSSTSPSRFVGAWTTNADGQLTFTATAEDTLGNAGTTTYVVTVDNTAPSQLIGKPTASFYSASIDVDAVATDVNGLSTYTLSGLAGFVDTDTSAARVQGAWQIPPAQADGSVSVAFKACDPVRNCSEEIAAPNVDRTPPTLSIAVAPPAWTNHPAISFAISAEDAGGAGVRRVIARNGSNVAVEASFDVPSGTWKFASIPVSIGTNVLKVWAEDLATPANSGEAAADPMLLTLTVSRDTTAPTISSVAFPSYRDETNATFEKNAAGGPLMPVRVTYAPGSKVDLSGGGTIYKLPATLSWGSTSPPSTAELEGTNPNNVPFRQFSVTYEPASDAPIASARWKIRVFATFSETTPRATYEGDLLPSEKDGTAANLRYFDLAFTEEVIPYLTEQFLTNYVFRIDLVVTDAAGNEATFATTNQMKLVPLPFAIVADSSYANTKDPRSAFAYSIAGQTYDDLFASGNSAFGSDKGVRVAKFYLHNPWKLPIGAVMMSGSSEPFGGRWAEDWGSTVYEIPGSSDGQNFTTPDGWSYRVRPYWDANPGSNFTQYCGAPLTNEYYPCGEGMRDTQFPYRRTGGSGFLCTAATSAPPYAPRAVNLPFTSMSGDHFRLFQFPSSTGGETVPAQTTTTGLNVIPAASASAPGSLAVYVEFGRPVETTSGRAQRPLVHQTVNGGTSARYQFRFGEAFKFKNPDGYCCNSYSDSCLARYQAYEWYEYLQASRVEIFGALAINSRALRQSGSSFVNAGPANEAPETSFTRVFTH